MILVDPGESLFAIDYFCEIPKPQEVSSINAHKERIPIPIVLEMPGQVILKQNVTEKLQYCGHCIIVLSHIRKTQQLTKPTIHTFVNGTLKELPFFGVISYSYLNTAVKKMLIFVWNFFWV